MPATYDSIASTQLGSSATTITLSGIPNTFTDLRLVLLTIDGTYPLFTFNSDTTTSYQQICMGVNFTDQSANYYNSRANMIGTFRTSGTATYPSAFLMDIFQYKNTSIMKNAMWHTLNDQATAANGGVERHLGIYLKTDTITSIRATAASGTFAAGTRIALYGILRA